VQGYDDATYGDRFADVYDEWYDGITDAEAVADAVADLVAEAGGGAVLELGVGTGRLALPIAARGIEVVGVDASEAMLERLAAKVADASRAGRTDQPAAEVRGLLGDMADPPTGAERFAVVLVAYNTLFNLVDPGAQQACIASAAARLAPGGSLLVEAFVPQLDQPATSVEPRTIAADRVVLSVSRADPVSQEAMGQYVDITEAGIALRPWHIRWSTPEQLDDMARSAGLGLVARTAGWRGEPFDATSGVHVSRYRAPAPAPAP
jgi:SAM-dependent methyltransferase